MPTVGAWKLLFHDAPPQPGDEVVGGWSRERLERMNRKFVDRLERAIARGEERKPAGNEINNRVQDWHGARRSA